MSWLKTLLIIVLIFSTSLAAADDAVTGLTAGTEPTSSADYVLGRSVSSQFNYTVNLRVPKVMFGVDQSGSMGSAISNVRSNIKDFYRDLGPQAQGTVLGANSLSSGEEEAEDLVPGEGLSSDVDDLETGAERLSDGDSFEGPDSTVKEAVGFEPEASDYSSNDYQDDEQYSFSVDEPKAVIWVQDGSTVIGDSSCDAISDFNSGGLGNYMENNNFEFYAIVANVPDCKDNYQTAADNTGGAVYDLGSEQAFDDTLEDISSSIDTKLDLNMVLPPHNVPISSYDASGSDGERYVLENVDSSEGEKQKIFKWRPTDYGDIEMVTADSYIQTDTGEKYYFDPPSSQNVKYVDFDVTDYSVFRSSSGIEVNFTVENKGNVASKNREVWVADGLGSSPNHRSLTLDSLTPGESSTFELSFDGSNVFADPESVYVRVDPIGMWSSTSHGEGEALEPDEQNNVVDIGYPPKPQGVAPSAPNGIDWGDSMQPQFRFAHQNPGNIDGVYNFTNGTSRQKTDGVMAQSTDSGDAILTPDDSFFSNPAERWYNYTVRAKDQRGAETVYSTSYYVENPKPTASALNPRDGGTVTEFPVDLSTRAKDENSRYNNRKLDVTIFDADTGNALAQGAVNPGGKLSYTWNIPNALTTTYQWKVQVTDKWDSTNRTFSFTKITGSRYRTDLGMEMNYSSLSVKSGNNRYTSITLRNNVENEKDLTLELKGIEAEFLDGSDTKNIQNFEGQSTKTYTIRVKPDKATDEDLTVVATNNKLGIETKTTIPVTSLPDNTEANEVPGIGAIQIIFILVSSSLLAFIRN